MGPGLKKNGAAPSLREAGRVEAGLGAFLTAGGFKGFTTSFDSGWRAASQVKKSR